MVKTNKASGFKFKGNLQWVLVGVVILVIVGFVFLAKPETQFTQKAEGKAETSTTNLNPYPEGSPLLRKTYFREAFKPKRDTYKLFEKASEYLEIPLEHLPAYFGLNSEEDIFDDLPAVPEDFSEIAYMLVNGDYFTIGYLDEGYYKQPEFYPYFKDQAFKYWTQPDEKYWGVTGFGTYPAEQWDVLTIGEREEFTAVVFMHTGWNVQTWQGVHLRPNPDSLEYFDLTVSPETFLLDPTFPEFGADWAYKIVIKGKLKQGVKPGNYVVGINVAKPPENLKEKWKLEYKKLYFDAVSSIIPSGNQIQFDITVKEKE